MIEVGMASVAMSVLRQSRDEEQDRERDQDARRAQVELHLVDRRA